MKIISIVLIIFLTSCGYDPIYLNKNLENFEYQEIISEGDKNINKKIINSLNIKKNNKNKNKFLISSSFKIDEISKNSKGHIELYKSTLTVLIKVKDSKNLDIKSKNYFKEFTYSNKDNKFELVEYQKSIQKNLIEIIIGEIILFLNS
tara:strand:- start:435 stop:878 length:444 start_codon:yes stop_codon:yes gene_type:complete